MTNKENPPLPPLLAGVAAPFRWNPALKALYERLSQRGKPHTLALVACALKLLVFANAVPARGTFRGPKTGRCLMVATALVSLPFARIVLHPRIHRNTPSAIPTDGDSAAVLQILPAISLPTL